jgi:phosphoglycerate dehydrogenase-like enzyme
MRPRILVITPVDHIRGLTAALSEIGDVTYLPHPTADEVAAAVREHDAIFTNPNKSDVFLGPEVMDAGTRLAVISTASTGTAHIDKTHAEKRGITVLALTEERALINRISSTAEHALALTLAAIRHIPQSFDAVRAGEWDYTKFIGRQLDHLTVGIVGFGRLGSFYAKYASACFARVLACDPYVRIAREGVEQVDIDYLVRESDVISLHVHLNDETRGMVDRSWFDRMKEDVVLVNTARGEVIDERALIAFLTAHPSATIAADVIADEVAGKTASPLVDYARRAGNAIVTPHVGGMTVEGQRLAYTHAAGQLRRFFDARVGTGASMVAR